MGELVRRRHVHLEIEWRQRLKDSRDFGVDGVSQTLARGARHAGIGFDHGRHAI